MSILVNIPTRPPAPPPRVLGELFGSPVIGFRTCTRMRCRGVHMIEFACGCFRAAWCPYDERYEGVTFLCGVRHWKAKRRRKVA